MNYDVFISYSRSDVKIVKRFAQQLRDRKLKIFFDLEDINPGISWSEQIDDAIQISDTF